MWNTLSARAVIGLIGITALGLLACAREAPVGRLPRPECPEGGGWRAFFAPRGETPPFGPTNGGELTLSPGITEIVEFHDCQQFIVTDAATKNLRYTSLVAIFARLNLDSTYRPPAHLVAGFDSMTTGIPMATIFAYDSAYAPLGIENGFNCLYFFRSQAGGVPGWQARVVPVQRSEAKCAIPLPPADTRGTMLAVSIAPSTDVPPPVARWDWDTTSKQQYIGIRCGNDWCEVHPTPTGIGAAFSSSVPLRVLESRAKGWYDEQLLTLAEGSTGMPAQVSNIIGTFIPAADLGEENGTPESSRFAGAWRTVATVAIRGNPGRYSSKLNLIETGEASARNVVALCYVGAVTAGSCPGLDTSALKCSSSQWYARIVHNPDSESPVTRFFCVIRRAHDGSTMSSTRPIPGVVRWRWLLNDETMWVRCLHGCCEVNAT